MKLLEECKKCDGGRDNPKNGFCPECEGEGKVLTPDGWEVRNFLKHIGVVIK